MSVLKSIDRIMKSITLNNSVVKAAWMPADNSEKRTKGQWHKWYTEAFNFFREIIYFTF